MIQQFQAKKDLHWIRGALQAAVSIEHATMPVYSAAMYSLEVQNYPAYNTIRSVLMEEMLDMAAAANMLAGIGGTPMISGLNPRQLRLGLPAGVAPGLTARCARLSRRQLNTFMQIEAPAELSTEAQGGANGGGAPYPSIGSFYAQIRDAIIGNASSVRNAAYSQMKANQVGGNLGYHCIDSEASEDVIDQLLRGIDLIIDQGEGRDSTRDAGAESDGELSHYARFAELRYGRRYAGPPPADDGQGASLTPESQRRYYRGEQIQWPRVINTLAVPDDGYALLLRLDPEGPGVRRELLRFDEAYTNMLQALEGCWLDPVEQSWPNLGRAVYEMNELRVTSCFNIMRHQVPVGLVSRLPELYPTEFEELSSLTDLSAPVFYGPRFTNLSS